MSESSGQYIKGLLKVILNEVDVLNNDLRIAFFEEGITTDLNVDEYLDDLDGTLIVATSLQLNGIVLQIDTTPSPQHHISLTCDDITLPGVSGSEIYSAVLYVNTGNPLTSPLLSYFSGPSLRYVPDGTDVEVKFSNLGLMRWSR